MPRSLWSWTLGLVWLGSHSQVPSGSFSFPHHLQNLSGTELKETLQQLDERPFSHKQWKLEIVYWIRLLDLLLDGVLLLTLAEDKHKQVQLMQTRISAHFHHSRFCFMRTNNQNQFEKQTSGILLLYC
jgi:hypothetical protein